MRSLVILLLIASCGKYEATSSAQLGQLIKFEPQELNTTQISQKEKICNAIIAKTARLRNEHGASYSFTVSESNCSGERSSEEQVNVKVDVSDTSINFTRADGNFFIFKDAGTNLSGIFKSYCEATTMPFIHNQIPVWVDVESSAFCTKEGNRDCVNFKSGLKEPNSVDMYRITTQETFKLDTLSTSSRYGFYTHRVLQSSASCSESGLTIIRANLN